MNNPVLKPDLLFEVSWEVCNKVGGIHTVVSTKALSVMSELNKNYILIGPDVWRDTEKHPEFEEDTALYADWREAAARDGIRVRVGRWNISGNPVAVMVDFTPYIPQKDDIFKSFWETYKLDSISGQWDYVEPTLFGYAAGKAMESFIRFYEYENRKIIAQFHEWMTGAGLLYLKKYLPQVGTVFTTHSTAVGRAIAGNDQPLYSGMKGFNGDAKAREFNIVSKQSLEKISGQQADAFTTVSNLTAAECSQFLEKDVDIVTPNGFDDSFVPGPGAFDQKRQEARKKLLEVASAITGEKLPDNALLIANSGRYEFRNKGIDLFVDALGRMNRNKDCRHKAVAFILAPANHYGARKDLVEVMSDPQRHLEGDHYLSHNLHYAEYDPTLNRFRQNGLNNTPDDPVKVIFVPSYLNGNDGVFNIPYYDLLIGFDLTVFPSYYEPWGYTPMESLAFSIPTITTTLTGLGLWVNSEYDDPGKGITVIPRDDFNDKEVSEEIAKTIMDFCGLGEDEVNGARQKAFEVSRTVLWNNLISYYWQAYDIALKKSVRRTASYFEKERVEKLPETEQLLMDIQPVWRRVLIHQNIPESLQPLEELSRNLWWSWNQDAIDLFESINPELWAEVEGNPIVLLDKLSYEKLLRLERSESFRKKLEKVYGEFRNYMSVKPGPEKPTIAYFSMEFGLHSSLKIYSGGLGLLAGDYLKESSDYNSNIVGIGLLYRYGYFKQVLSSSGEQVAQSDLQDFSRLPVTPVRDNDGTWKTVWVMLPGRTLTARIWKVEVGRVTLYLLDADYEANIEQDRFVTHFLYGGDNENRFKQELLLGIGGIRALRAIGVNPDIYHINEGHAAFIGLERLREFIQDRNMTFPEASEIVRASSLFTTHTPVPAGHDYFEEDLMRAYIAHYPERLRISWNQLMNLGRMHPNNKSEKFSMSCLAVNLSLDVNGVSQLHGEVSKHMFSAMWKGYMTEEVHIGYVTNGVHLPTWVSADWRKLYQTKLDPDFLNKQEDRSLWEKIYEVPDEEIWKIKSEGRASLISYIKERLSRATIALTDNPRQMIEISGKLDPDALTIGFARRFATYKRAHLLFRDPQRLSEIVNNPKRPVQFVFAGKAHPKDIPGQDLIKMIVSFSKRPEFLGKIIFLEDYNIDLAKKLLHGVDIWLNTPTRPLEASGTSGEKAVMNGTLHFSVLDGWWAEGYRENAGWALPLNRTYDNQDLQDQLDAERIYSMLEDEITTKFYKRSKTNVPAEWVKVIKNSIAKVAPEFTMNRMVRDYCEKYYRKLFERTLLLRENDYKQVKELAYWKNRILTHWKNIQVIDYDFPNISREQFIVGQTYTGKVKLDLDGLTAEEIGVEMVMVDSGSDVNNPKMIGTLDFICTHTEGNIAEYTFIQQVGITGLFDIGFRIYPKHDLIPHRMDFPLVRWI
ncbi:MAG: alpha-glucan family phosphorylase [Bacteroidota bacterium]